MEVKPPKLAEAIVRWLLPPACVEHVLGDLEERMQDVEPSAARRQYVMDSILTLPAVIFSRVFRRCDAELVRIYVATLCVLFTGALLFPHSWRIEMTPRGFTKIGCAIIAVLVYKLIEDAYRPLGIVFIVFKVSLLFYIVFGKTLASELVAGYGYLVFVQWLFEYFTRPHRRKTS